MLDAVGAIWPELGGLRLMGSAALGLAYVACGRLDAYVHPSLYPWDVVAGLALVGEAGGEVTDWEGQPATMHSTRVVAGNKTLHGHFLGLIRDTPQLRLKGV
jgi:myo-inositol-1(or 4)-monophosphatase